MQAKMIVPYGRYVLNETVRGTSAVVMVDEGYAVEISTSKPKVTKRKKKNAGGAPENKAVK